MGYRDDEDHRLTHGERELAELKYFGPIALVVFLVLFLLSYLG